MKIILATDGNADLEVTYLDEEGKKLIAGIKKGEWPWPFIEKPAETTIRTFHDAVMVYCKNAPPPKMTRSQFFTLRLLAEGLTYKQTAIRAGKSTRTIIHHAHNLKRILKCDSKAELILMARKLFNYHKSK